MTLDSYVLQGGNTVKYFQVRVTAVNNTAISAWTQKTAQVSFTYLILIPT
jgi:hypothetical protein